MNIQYIAGPAIGALIGLITNGIAIRMLFRPLYPVKIGGFQLPFTPGLIPKERPRIAKAIGKVIGDELLDTETLQKALASDNLKQAFSLKVDSVIEMLGKEDGTLADLLERKGYLETIDSGADYIGDGVSNYIAERVVEQNLGEEILEYAFAEIMGNLNPMAAMVAEPAVRKSMPVIAMKLDEVILQKSPELLKSYVDKEYHKWRDMPMSEAGVFLWQRKEQIKDKIWEFYLKILEEKAESFISRLDVSGIVEEKINEFDVSFLEKLIMEIARKELNALVWIGGALGMLIGFVNVLF
ncbi:MAG: DUF445 family protein [Blautia sp.]|nr:DUF445 family protein [Blautia sp.]